MGEQDRAYQVKGSTVRSKFDFVHEQFGEQARQNLEELFKGRGLLPILVSGWYDYDLYIEVLETIASAHFAGDLSELQAIGAYSADQSLRTVYAAFVRQGGFVEFLRGISRLHHMFYNAGELVVNVESSQHAATIWHRDKPRLADADLHVAAGFYRKAAEIHEGANVSASVSANVSAKRAPSCDFAVRPDGAHFTVSW